MQRDTRSLQQPVPEQFGTYPLPGCHRSCVTRASILGGAKCTSGTLGIAAVPLAVAGLHHLRTAIEMLRGNHRAPFKMRTPSQGVNLPGRSLKPLVDGRAHQSTHGGRNPPRTYHIFRYVSYFRALSTPPNSQIRMGPGTAWHGHRDEKRRLYSTGTRAPAATEPNDRPGRSRASLLCSRRPLAQNPNPAYCKPLHSIRQYWIAGKGL